MILSDIASDEQTYIASFLSYPDALNFCCTNQFIRESVLAYILEQNKTLTNCSSGATRLMCAASCRMEDLPKINFITRLGGKKVVSIQDKFGETALHLAVRACSLEVSKILCEVGGQDLVVLKNSLGNSALHDAVNMEDIDMIEVLCQTGRQKAVMLQNNMGVSAIHCAVEIGNVEITYLLCEAGGKEAVSLKNNDGNTPLSLATQYFHAEIAIVLSNI